MRAPTNKQLLAWWSMQPQTGDATCTYCGKVGPVAYVQPQHPFYAEGREGAFRCTDCYNATVGRSRAQRKAELAAEPRCEVSGCRRRGNWRAAGVLLCGRHLKAAQREHTRVTGGFGILGGLMDYDRSDVLRWANAVEEVTP